MPKGLALLALLLNTCNGWSLNTVLFNPNSFMNREWVLDAWWALNTPH